MKRAIKLGIIVGFIFVLSFVATASANPLNSAWYVADSANNPINGAALTIYYSTSASGPFTPLPTAVCEDVIANAYHNPVYTAYFNPSHPAGNAVVDIHLTSISSYFFYVQIDYNGKTWYWPIAGSQKPGDSTWSPVAASGSPSGYAATGDGLGNGVTTGFPITEPPNFVVPEYPWAGLAALSSCIGAFVIFKKRDTIAARIKMLI